MSASIWWQPDSPTSLDGASTSVARQLQKAFGDYPISLSLRNMDTLNGMATMYDGEPNPFEVLAHAIGEFGSIIVTVNY